jgi:hypothetical protein
VVSVWRRVAGAAAFLAVGGLASLACSDSTPRLCPQTGLPYPVNKPFNLPGCGVCTCDEFGDVDCSMPQCSGPYHRPDAAASVADADAAGEASDAD